MYSSNFVVFPSGDLAAIRSADSLLFAAGDFAATFSSVLGNPPSDGRRALSVDAPSLAPDSKHGANASSHRARD